MPLIAKPAYPKSDQDSSTSEMSGAGIPTNRGFRIQKDRSGSRIERWSRRGTCISPREVLRSVTGLVDRLYGAITEEHNQFFETRKRLRKHHAEKKGIEKRAGRLGASDRQREQSRAL